MTSNPIFVLAQLGNWPAIGQHNENPTLARGDLLDSRLSV